MQKVIITAAVTGSRPTKEMNSAVPYSPAEIAEAAVACWRAGAAVAHIHVRDPRTGAPSSQLALFEDVLSRIRQECDMLVNLTTSGLNIAAANEDEVIARRLEPVTLRPDICSLDVGSMNFQDRPFVNSPRWAEAAARRMREAGVKPEIEVFDVGHIDQARDLIHRGLVADPPWFQLCMGIPWGIPASPENLIFMHNKLPTDCLWSVLGVGRHQLPMITMGVLLGGHVRVGFEDNLYRRRGELARDNAHLVEMAVDVIHALDQEPASPAEARALLGL
ncbi:MAG: 3-keto-5-aminohexanoate cleavage protein [Caldilineaceae bacterium]|nr:3-keto-5-aminohexanoate cleavage protein [Caldilineaceae bacterium]